MDMKRNLSRRAAIRSLGVLGAGAALGPAFAAGGAAAGVSGSTAAGYLSGNGLLTATVLGRLAGQAAARRTTHG